MATELDQFEQGLIHFMGEMLSSMKASQREPIELAMRQSPRAVLQQMFKPVSPAIAAWLRSIGASQSVIGQVETYWFKSEGIGEFSIHRDKELQPEWDAWPERAKARLLTVGGCPNGDPIVIDLDSGQVAYLGHEGGEASDPRAEMRIVADSLGSFILGAAKGEMPSDYYAD